jgi:hypothetical protein
MSPTRQRTVIIQKTVFLFFHVEKYCTAMFSPLLCLSIFVLKCSFGSLLVLLVVFVVFVVFGNVQWK